MVPASIVRLLNRLRWRDRWLGLARGAACAVALAIGAAVVAGAIDWFIDRWTDTPPLLSAVLTLAQIVAWVVGLWLITKPLLKRYTDDELALWIEQHVPTGQRLIAAVQLNRVSADVRGMSPQLIATVTRQADSAAARVDLSRVLDTSRLRQALYVAVPAVVVAGLLLAVAPVTCAALMMRLFGSDVDVPRSVRLQAEGKTVWPAGEEGVLRVRAVGQSPGQNAFAFAIVKPSQGRSFRVPLAFESEDEKGVVYSGKVPPADAPFTFGAWLADGRMRKPAEVRYAPRPVATSVQSWVQLPARLAKKSDGSLYEETMRGGDLFYRLSDAKGRVIVTAQVPLTKAWLEVIGEDKSTRTVPLTVSEDNSASGKFAFRPGDSAYEVHLIDENDFECIDRPRRAIRRLPLGLAEVTLAPETLWREGDSGTPEEREVEGIPILRTDNPKVGRRFRLEYHCEDRYGLSHARLRFRVIPAGKDLDAEAGKIDRESFLILPLGPPRNKKEPATEEAKREFSTLPSAGPDLLPDLEGKGQYDFSIDGIPDGKGGYVEMKEGDRIQFYVEAFGKGDPDGAPGRSAIREKEVVGRTQFDNWIFGKEDLKERTRTLEEQQRGVKVVD